MMENVVVNDHRVNLFLGIWEEIWELKDLKKSRFTMKSYEITLFTQIYSPKRYFGERFWEGFGAFLGNAERKVYCDKEKLQRAL